jgi:hypothetical protein
MAMVKAFFFFGGNIMAFIAQVFLWPYHQVHSAQGMMETGMQRPGIHQMCHPQLFNITQPLKVWVFDEVKTSSVGMLIKP